MNRLTNDAKLVHVLILDVSGIYSSIYDEFWCNPDKVNDNIRSYCNDKYRIITI